MNYNNSRGLLMNVATNVIDMVNIKRGSNNINKLFVN